MQTSSEKSTEQLTKMLRGDSKELLDDREQIFVEKYLRHFKPELAMMEAGYRGSELLHVSSLLKTKRIKLAITERLEMYTMSKEELLWRLSEQGRNSYSEYIDEHGNVNLAELIADGKAHLIKSLTPTRYGTKVEFMDGQKAMEMLGRYYKLFNGGEVSGEVTVRVVFEENLLTEVTDDPEDAGTETGEEPDSDIVALAAVAASNIG